MSPALLFCVLLLMVTVFLVANPMADSSTAPPPVSKPTPTHAAAQLR